MYPNRFHTYSRSRLMYRLGLALLASLVVVGAAGAQDLSQLTLQELAAGEPSDGKAAVDTVSLRVAGVELPFAGAADGPGESVALLVDRIVVFAPDAEIVVHTDGGERIEAPPRNVYYAGTVEDRPGSRAVLTLDADGGLRGVISDASDWWRIGTVPDKAAGAPTAVTEKVVSTGKREPFLCANESHELSRAPTGVPTPAAVPGIRRVAEPTATDAAGVAEKAASYTARIAFETDEAFLADFGGDTTLAADYVGDLVAFATTVYSDEVDTSWLVETISLWETTDPWSESGNFCRLLEFGKYWNDHRDDVDRTIAHFVAGGGGFSGIAWVGVLCEGDFLWDTSESGCSFSDTSNYGGAYGYTGGLVGNLDLSSPSPIWDIVALMHEIGHNFDSPHTHCYEDIGGNPAPVDRCYDREMGCWSGPEALPSGCPGPGNNCGTIMSYCHLSSAGIGLISGEISLALGEGFAYGTEPGRVPDRMTSHVVAEAGDHPGCLDFTEPNLIFGDDFETGDREKWDQEQQ